PVPETVPEPVPETVPAAPEPAAVAQAPRPSGERRPEPVVRTAAGLPSRTTKAHTKAPATADTNADTEAPAPVTVPGVRPALPERVPQTHIAQQLREPRAAETTVPQDAATPEEVADAWADYEHGTQTVEEELRRDRP
ncbi:hypothetical protein ACFWXG_31285, partial [Streptomyces sp. NPDC059072]